MSILPFNLLATEITANERAFLVENYDDAKQHFQVDKIDRLTSFSGAIQGRSSDIAGPGTFYFKIYASSDFSWFVRPIER